jgi:RNA polymerase primary sigma factor
LAARVAAGDRAARDRLIEAHLGLVVSIARRFLGRGLELEDLIGEGTLGLIQAADGFDPRCGARFGTFATYHIRRAICSGLTHWSTAIRLPGSMRSLLRKWWRAERALGSELGRAPSFDEIASSLGLSEARRVLVSRALDAGRLTLESSFGSGLRGGLSGVVMDRRRGPEEWVDARDERGVAWRLIGQFDGRERDILMLRFGMEGEGLSLAEIGRRLGLTRERVRQIEGRALSKLGQGHPEGEHDPRSAAGRDGFGEPGSRRRSAPVPAGSSFGVGEPARPHR